MRLEETEHELEVDLRRLVVLIEANRRGERGGGPARLVGVAPATRGEVAEREDAEQVARLGCDRELGARASCASASSARARVP